jgi:hypothetical protein
MLIDRNDELAALHEKAHTQEALIAAGTMELSIREDEVRLSGWLAGCRAGWLKVTAICVIVLQPLVLWVYCNVVRKGGRREGLHKCGAD